MAKLSENVKDMRRHVGKIFGKKQAQKIGTYQEAPGGGTAVDGGGRGAMKKNFKVVNSKEEADAIREENPKAVIRYNQPRDEDGRFTYNSANGKPIQEDKSRGVTVPPFLRGAKMVFATKKRGIVSEGTTWNFNINMTAGELTSKFQDIFRAKNAADSVERKKGRKSNVEKQAIKKKNEGFVKPDTNIHDALDYTIDYYIDDFKYRIGESMTGYKKKYKNKENKFSYKTSNMQKPEKPVQFKANSTDTSNKFDSNLAKTNKEEFKKQNKQMISDLVKKAPSFSEDEIVDIIAESGVSSKEEIENVFDKFLQF